MTPLVPVVRLREAARVLRERSKAATSGPWRAMPDAAGGHFVEQVHDGKYAGHWVVSAFVCEDHPTAHEPDARWIALTAPHIAEHQADLLDAIADVVEARPNWPAGRITTPALALADALLTAAGRQP